MNQHQVWACPRLTKVDQAAEPSSMMAHALRAGAANFFPRASGRADGSSL